MNQLPCCQTSAMTKLTTHWYNNKDLLNILLYLLFVDQTYGDTVYCACRNGIPL